MKHRDVFEQIDPPAGGLTRLRSKLEERPRAWWPRVAWVPAVALGAATLLVRVGGGSSDALSLARSQRGASEIGLGLAPPSHEAMALAGESSATAALMQVPSSDPHVTIYRLGTLR